MKLFLIIALLILFCNIPQSFSEEATIKINTNEVAGTPISKNIFGGFVEFLLDYINGENGMYAQELKDRGMDMNYRHISSADDWEVYSTGKGTKAELLKGGYNLNGQNYQKLSSSSFISKIGVYQNVYINDTVDYDFYMYAKSYEKNNITLTLIDSNFKISYFTAKVISDSLNWKKFTIKIPKLTNAPKRLNLLISIDSISSVDIDEVSLMQSNNTLGIRDEYCDLIEKWKPGIIRYPGGWFADETNSRLSYFMGPIDQRQSPNRSNTVNPNNINEYIPINQRLDFGLHEYLLFCEKFDIEPQLTVNTRYEDEKVAWDWIEYCIGDTNSKNGKIRSSLGHPKPFNLNYVEIGNENWYNVDKYLIKYVKFYDYIKERNKNIKLIVNLDHWNDSSLIKTMNYAKNKVDFISYHPTYVVPVEIKATDEQIFLSSVGCVESIEGFIYKYINWFKEKGYKNNVKQAVTEWWSSYANYPGYLADTSSRNSSLESALWNIGVLNAILRHPDEVPLSNRTNGIAMIKRGFDKNGNRSIYGAACFWAESMMSNFHGDMLVRTELQCQYYDAHDVVGIWEVWGAKRLDVTTTKSKDTIYISVINRHPNENVETSIIIDNVPFYGRAKVYYLNSTKYTDCNTENEPLKVVPKELTTILKGNYSLPPHSYSIIAIEYPKNSYESDDLVRYFKSDDVINSKINISLNEYPKENSRLKIYDLVGVEVFSTKLNINQLNYTFWLESLTDGIYFGNVGNNYFKFLKISE